MFLQNKTTVAKYDQNRRAFLKSALSLTLLGLSSRSVLAQQARCLTMFCPATGESLRAEYWNSYEGYLPDAMQSINHLMRDRRTDDVIDMEPELIDLLSVIQQQLDTTKPLHLISGYRSPVTNAMCMLTAA